MAALPRPAGCLFGMIALIFTESNIALCYILSGRLCHCENGLVIYTDSGNDVELCCLGWLYQLKERGFSP